MLTRCWLNYVVEVSHLTSICKLNRYFPWWLFNTIATAYSVQIGNIHLICSLIIWTGCRVQVCGLILDSAVGLSAGIQSAGDLVSETLVRILHSAEEDNLSPSDSNIARLCQSTEKNNKHACMYIYIYIYICTFVFMYVCKFYMDMYVCMYV